MKLNVSFINRIQMMQKTIESEQGIDFFLPIRQ